MPGVGGLPETLEETCLTVPLDPGNYVCKLLGSSGHDPSNYILWRWIVSGGYDVADPWFLVGSTACPSARAAARSRNRNDADHAKTPQKEAAQKADPKAAQKEAEKLKTLKKPLSRKDRGLKQRKL